MANSTSERLRYPLAEKTAFGLLTAGGVMSAAIVSGLSSIQCRALAIVYVQSLREFGAAALAGLIILFLSYWTHSSPGKGHRITIGIFVYTFFALGMVSLFGGMVTGLDKLEAVTAVCWTDKSAPPGFEENQWKWTFSSR